MLKITIYWPYFFLLFNQTINLVLIQFRIKHFLISYEVIEGKKNPFLKYGMALL